MAVHPGHSPSPSGGFDICIVGAGAAGIVLALELAGASLRVVVLEGGGVSCEDENQPSHLATAGEPITLREGSPYFLGGNTNYWYGNCRPLESHDFEPRDWIPHSGWPIGPADLEGAWGRTQEYLGLGGFRWYDVDECRPELRHGPVMVSENVLRTRMVQTTPVFELADVHRERLVGAGNVRVALGRRVTRLITAFDGRVTAVESVSADGVAQTTEADVFVLAAGGVENARLMLAPGDDRSGAIGNDLVGRFFMEHPYVTVAPEDSAFDKSPHRSSLRLYEDRTVGARGRELGLKSRQTVGDAKVWAQLAVSPELARRERAPGLSIWFRPVTTMPSSVRAAREIVAAVRRRSAPSDLRSKLVAAVRDPLRTARFLAWKLAGIGAPSDLCEMIVQIEHVPHPDNRVYLTDEMDCTSVHRAQLSVTIDDDQMDAHARTLRIACDELGLDGAGVVRQFRRKFAEHDFGFFDHHMGTTRMSDDPTKGVVDRDCKVHGVENLFVAGSSVFPTAGTAAPTLTLVALAVRLADHLRGLAGDG